MYSSLADYENIAAAEADRHLLMVAFASSDGECVNQHFGSSQGFQVYGVSAESAILLTSKVFEKEKKDGNEDKLKPKLSWLYGADLVYVGSIGGSATKQLVMLGAHPVVVKGGPEIEDIIEELQKELKGKLSPTLQRIYHKKSGKSENRFDEMEELGWDD